MKIDVILEDGKHFFIPFPTWLGLNRITAGIALAVLREQAKPAELAMDWEDISRWLTVFRKMEREYKGLCIVDVQSADGEKVKIIL